MDLHERQQADFLLETATQRFVAVELLDQHSDYQAVRPVNV